MIRVLIVDDHVLVREAFCLMLMAESDMDVVGQVGDGRSVLTQCRELHPDLVLMDIALPDMSGIEVTRQLLAIQPSPRVLAVSSYFDRRTVETMLEAGATGYVSKGAGADEFLQGVRALMAGTLYLSKDVAALLRIDRDERNPAGVNVRLGRREMEVLALIARGRTSLEIAALLHIAQGTVEVHRYNITNKLGLHGIAELTKYALRTGLIARE